MKKCPQCGREYNNTMSFCLDDGTGLLYGPASADEPATAILHETRLPSAAATRTLIHPTEQSAVLPSRSAESARKGFDRRLLAVAVALAVLIFGGFLGYRYLNPSSGRAINSIAVLPFENRSGSPDSEYLSDGLSDSLIFRLTQLPNLKVSPTSSMVRYKGKQADVAEIAKDLEVDAVMSGKLAQRGEDLTISVELIDARTKKLIWAEQYDRKMADLLATQREIATTITQKLQLKHAAPETKGITKSYTDNNEAYQLYLKGRFYFARRTKDDLYKSIELFQQAIKLDPNFALAYVGIAESYAVIPSYPYASPAESMPQAKAAVTKALELDPELPEAYTVSAMIAVTYDWDWAKAEREFKRSFELAPNLANTHYRYAWYLSAMGRHDEAVAEMKKAMELEPLSLIQGANFAGVLMYARRFDEAVNQARRTSELAPNFIPGTIWLAHTYNVKGMYAESLAIAEKTLDSDTPILFDAGYAYAKTGRRQEALAIIDRWKQGEKTKYVLNYWVAVTYAALGDKDAAFAKLEKAYKARDWFLHRIKFDPFMDPLRGDARYDELLRKLDFPQ